MDDINIKISAEQQRLESNASKTVPLEKWGPYLSERQWGTVREDYSENGDAWNYFPHDHARSRAYRWGEDGLGGISDYMQDICFSTALWNGHDPILKERPFGLTNGEGNHGEDVKELYYYLDNVPSHYYMKYLYKYPHAKFPYEQLIEANRNRSKAEPEFEILDTGVFNDQKYFDVVVEYAKNNCDDIFIKIEVTNRGSEDAPITVLPTLWFYNRWQYSGLKQKPDIHLQTNESVEIVHERCGTYYLYFQNADSFLFTENETNLNKLYGGANITDVVKDAFNDAIVSGIYPEVLKQKKQGTKFCAVYNKIIPAGKSIDVVLRLVNHKETDPFKNYQQVFDLRRSEADEFYDTIIQKDAPSDLKNIQRQAFAGLLWSKQYYHFDVETWLNTGDGITPVSSSRLNGRNHNWKFLKNQDIISMPDKWEYPWYASWDAAFHSISMSIIDPVFAKNQLLLLMREWYMNPEGQLPAYEWDFNDVNPPVHALSALEIYKTEKKMRGIADVHFLKRIFQKLIINFTWWVNRKDFNGNNVFEGGFLGLDNIGIFNRSIQLPNEIALEQTDGTSWMGMYALNMMEIAIEIASSDSSFQDTATKFYEHFVIIAAALNEMGLWNEADRFFYDVLCLNGEVPFALKVRSVVGLIPLFAVSIIDQKKLAGLTDFQKRIEWFKNYRIENNKYLPSEQKKENDNILLSLVHKERLMEILQKFLDEAEFLSPGGIRALSKFYDQNPYHLSIENENFSIQYDPADSTSGLFGGNSNWRGPVWMPINYLFIKSLQKYGDFYGDSCKVECPMHSGQYLSLNQVASFLITRITNIFSLDENQNRPVFGDYNWFYKNENKDLLQYHEYFHGDNSRGLGASHQTGWTALLLNLLRE